MKYIFVILVILTTGFHTQGVFSADYKTGITKNESPNNPNTDSNIDKAKLICKHVSNFKKNLETIVSKYGLGADTTLEKTIELVEKMEISCEVIQTKQIEKKDAASTMTSIVEDLSILNKGVKDHLKEEIGKIKIEHERYIKIGNKIAFHLDILISKLEKRIYQDNNVDSRESQQLKHTRNLKKISKTLKEFDIIEFYKTDEMRSSMIRIIKDIRSEIKNIKEA